MQAFIAVSIHILVSSDKHIALYVPYSCIQEYSHLCSKPTDANGKFLTYLVIYLLTYLPTHSLTYLLTYLLTYFLTYLFLTYLLTQPLTYFVEQSLS